MRARAKHCAVSIDLDGIACYYRIHGLGPAPAELEHVILERALPRAAALFAQRGVHVTWFVIGRDADGNSTLPDHVRRAANAQRLRTLADNGDELGNHSYSHPYELARLAPATIDDEIASCDRVLRDILAPRGGNGVPASAHVSDLVQLGKRTEAPDDHAASADEHRAPMTAPRGFRAPGYDVAPAMLDTLARLGYRYDSSIFPAPGYYAAKAVVMSALALVGRPSGAVLTNPRALAAPADPYRPSMTSPWRRGQAPVVELPIAVTPWTRVPAIGTTLLVAPPWARERMLGWMSRRAFFNLELHGIDFADAEKDGIPGELVDRQPDLRIPVDDKLATLDRMLDTIAERWQLATLAEVAADVQRDE
jgi:peptidoglycan/xylan/chitin deacetylase (PgdA/CDA1 family)